MLSSSTPSVVFLPGEEVHRMTSRTQNGPSRIFFLKALTSSTPFYLAKKFIGGPLVLIEAVQDLPPEDAVLVNSLSVLFFT
jgi:hypothetical protein